MVVKFSSSKQSLLVGIEAVDTALQLGRRCAALKLQLARVHHGPKEIESNDEILGETKFLN